MEVSGSAAISVYRFEEFCGLLFERLGYDVQRNVRVNNKTNFYEIDLILTNKLGETTVVDCKVYRTVKPGYSFLLRAANQLVSAKVVANAQHALLIVAASVDEVTKYNIENNLNIVVLDSKNILSMVKDDVVLFDEFKVISSDLSEETMSEDTAINIDLIGKIGQPIREKNVGDSKPNEYLNYFVDELKSIEPGRAHYPKYEKLCTEAVKYLFEGNLSKFITQQRTGDDLNRFDLVCRVNRGNHFWDLIIDEFNSRYIIFEFKNYTDELLQTQMYTTEKYLFKAALRNVAFVVSRKGASRNSVTVTEGILRETGKLIVNLNDDDLKGMIEMKDSGSEPSDHLFSIVDNFLLSLSK